MDRLTDDERRLLDLLAGSVNGVSETLLGTRFTRDMMVGLVRERLTKATLERTFIADKPVEVTRVRITDAGRRALAWTARNKTRKRNEPSAWPALGSALQWLIAINPDAERSISRPR